MSGRLKQVVHCLFNDDLDMSDYPALKAIGSGGFNRWFKTESTLTVGEVPKSPVALRKRSKN